MPNTQVGRSQRKGILSVIGITICAQRLIGQGHRRRKSLCLPPAGRPLSNLALEPKLASACPQIYRWPWHIGVPVLVRTHAVRV